MGEGVLDGIVEVVEYVGADVYIFVNIKATGKVNMRKIIIAPDSFKETLSAVVVAQTIASALQRAMPNTQIVCLPLADGGEGTAAALVEATNGRIIETSVSSLLNLQGKRVVAQWGLLPPLNEHGTAVIDIAAASGLGLIPHKDRNPLVSSTYGTGEIILKALDLGVRDFIIGLGGSATNDAGTGLLRALGLQLNDESGAPVGFGGAALAQVHSINAQKLDLRLMECTISVACDVDNPLLGPKGASVIYGPQKGATTSMVTQLDAALEHFANVSEAMTGLVHRDHAGAGAAGGTGFGLMQYTKAQFQPGIDLVLDRIEFDAHLSDADLVITGEGRLDSQSLNGKAPVGVAKRAKQHGLFVMAIVGSVDVDETLMVEAGIDACFSIMPGVSDLPKAIENAVFNLDQCAYNVGKLISFKK